MQDIFTESVVKYLIRTIDAEVAIERIYVYFCSKF